MNPLAVIGSYERTSGGVDVISARLGGLNAALGEASRQARLGRDVLIEGNRLSFDTDLTAALAGRHPVLVLQLDTSPEACARNLLRRQRRGREDFVRLRDRSIVERALTQLTCESIRGLVSLRRLDFDSALSVALRALGASTNLG